MGWYLDAELTNLCNFTEEAEVDFTLYAAWEPNQYTIYFDSNGGNYIPSSVQDYGTTIVEPSVPINEIPENNIPYGITSGTGKKGLPEGLLSWIKFSYDGK